MTFLERAELAGQRAKGYWLLSRLFLEVPTTSSLTDLLATVAENAEDIEDQPSEEIASLRHAVEEALSQPDVAAVDFTRYLVLGDAKHSERLPFEAHVREGKLPGEATQRIFEMMTRAGYGNVAPEAPSPDHIGSELRFMALLCHGEYEAWQDGNAEAAANSLQTQRQLLMQHLLEWIPGYCRELVERTNNGYLQGIAHLTATAVEDDLGLLERVAR